MLLVGAGLSTAELVIPAGLCDIFTGACNSTRPLAACCPASAETVAHSVPELVQPQLCVLTQGGASCRAGSDYPAAACCINAAQAEAPAVGILPEASCQLLDKGFTSTSCSLAYPSPYCCNQGFPHQNPAGVVAGITCTPSSTYANGSQACTSSVYTSAACCHGGLAPAAAPSSAQAP